MRRIAEFDIDFRPLVHRLKSINWTLCRIVKTNCACTVLASLARGTASVWKSLSERELAARPADWKRKFADRVWLWLNQKKNEQLLKRTGPRKIRYVRCFGELPRSDASSVFYARAILRESVTRFMHDVRPHSFRHPLSAGHDFTDRLADYGTLRSWKKFDKQWRKILYACEAAHACHEKEIPARPMEFDLLYPSEVAVLMAALRDIERCRAAPPRRWDTVKGFLVRIVSRS